MPSGGRRVVKLVTAVVKPHKLDDVKAALAAYGINGLTITEAMGYGRQRGQTEVYRGTEYTVDIMPKVRIEILCGPGDAPDVARVIATAARTGRIGDGKVWITSVDQIIRIRTGELDEEAV
jgi:nitrogen regulatory protein P-II 1